METLEGCVPNKRVLLIDFQNQLHRARSGFTLGEHCIAFNFLRSLKSLIETLQPTRVILVKDGHPKFRYDLFPEYKGTRTPLSPAVYKQFDEVTDILSRYFPVSVVGHPDYEADDVIYTLIKHAAKCVEHVVVSSDTDFIQLLDEFTNVRIYNPIKKEFIEKFDCDYVTWKSLKGDTSDNISGLAGVGEATAMSLTKDAGSLQLFLEKDVTHQNQFDLNKSLIKLADIKEEEFDKFKSSSSVKDWEQIKKNFEDWDFRSMTKDPYWSKFTAAFDSLLPSE